MTWVSEHLAFLLSLAAIAVGVWLLLPRRAARPRWTGLLLVLGGGIVQGGLLEVPGSPLVEEVLFWTFGGGGLLCGVFMITSHNPVYGALWFALVTLCTCGLFVLQDAPFLAAATIIVYAGAIIVTFLFVIMLAQQSGTAAYDRRAAQALLSCLVAFVLLGALLVTLQTSRDDLRETASVPVTAGGGANPLSRPEADQPLGTVQRLGRSLFGDYLFAVELAGTLLLIASIGAIAVAPRRGQGTL